MKKRVLSLFMALALCFSMLPTAAWATENTSEPSTQLTETTSVPEEPEEPETPDQPEETKTPDQGEDTKTPDQGEDTKTPDPSEEPPQDEDPPAAEEVAPVGAMLSAAATTGEEHTHYLCGGDTCNKVGHADEGTATTFQPWDGSNTNGAFYLTKDWTLTSTITVPTGSSLTLCLNGYSITLGSQAHNVDPGSYDVFLVQRRATFTLCECKDKNGNYGTIGHYNPTENQGPGVNVAGTFNMYGGKIFQNQVKSYNGNPRGYGGGVLVSNTGAFNMFGGEITGNTAKSGGVYVDGMFSMSGGTIYDNAGERGGGVYVTPNGMFNMSGSAAITGNTGSYGGVYVNGTFSMSGGTICGNTESYGGGVYVDLSGTFNMSGSAAITGNTVTENGGGVYVRDIAKKMNVSGDVTITENKKADKTANNVYLPDGKTITIDESLSQNARIGVTTAKAPTSNGNILIATGATKELSHYTNIFTPDVQNQGCVIAKNEDNLSVHQHSWGYTANGATITATCRVSGCPNPHGGSVTIAAPTELTYNGSGKAAVVTASGDDWQGPAVKDISIGYTKTGKQGQEKLENSALPTNAGTYTASITLGGQTASVTYTIEKATPSVGNWQGYPQAQSVFSGNAIQNPTLLTIYLDGKPSNLIPVDQLKFNWYNATKNGNDYVKNGDALGKNPTDAGDYIIEAVFAGDDNINAATSKWGLTIGKAQHANNGDSIEVPLNVYPVSAEYIYEVDIAKALENIPHGGGLEPDTTYGGISTNLNLVKQTKWDNGKLKVTMKPLASITGTTLGSITVNLTSKNYTVVPVVVNITLQPKREVQDISVSMDNWTYGEKAKTPRYAVIAGAEATVTYAAQGSSDFSTTVPTNAGNYTVKVQYETTIEIHTGTANFTIEPKSIAGATVTLKKDGNSEAATTLELPYTGTQQTVKVGSVTLKGMTDALAENMDYTVDTNVNGTNAGQYTVTVTGKGNYTGVANVSWEITPAPLTITGATAESRAYKQGDKAVKITSVTFGGVMPSGTPFQMNTDYTATGKMNDDKAGDSKDVNVTVELKNTNYTLNETTTTTTVKITKANWNKAKANGSAKFGTSGTVDLTDLIAPGGTAAVEGELPADSVLDGTPTVVDGKLNFTFKSDATVGSTAIVKVNVTKATNYNDYEIAVTLTVLDKYPPVYTAPKAIENLVYNGKEQDLIVPGKVTNGGKMLYKVGTDDGKWTETVPKGKEATSYTVFYKIEGTDDVAAIEATQVGVVTIAQKKATIRPKSVTITKGDAFPTFELEYIGLVNGEKLTSSEKPTFRCLKELSSATQVTDSSVPGKYPIEWMNSNKITFNDGTNYELSKENIGYLTIQAQSSGGGSSSSGGGSSSSGGGGSSSSSKPSTTGKTDTTIRPDGTKVQTETRADGTKIQTVTGKDGSTVKTTTNPNGSSVTETKAADGSTATVKTDKHGQTTAETALSSKAVENAKRSGEPVTAPVEVKATRDSGTAPTVKVELPRNSGDTKVEIPVTNVRPGTVAVLVHPDGTEEIVKNSLPTEDGIQLTVNGGATVKIVDNSKDFIDTRNHWAKDAIDFVSARGLVSGVNATSYAPNASTTRAQLWTILARQNNADLTGGATWFENAQNWAKAKGISDGANPNGTINRAQMVTMLYRAAGSPEVSITTTFTDVPADSYYAQAVAWAIENGITAGVGGGRFDPNSTCTRAQIATFLHRSYLSK